MTFFHALFPVLGAMHTVNFISNMAHVFQLRKQMFYKMLFTYKARGFGSKIHPLKSKALDQIGVFLFLT